MEQEKKQECYEQLNKEQYEELVLPMGDKKMLLYYDKTLMPFNIYDGSMEIALFLRNGYKKYLQEAYEAQKKAKEDAANSAPKADEAVSE